jgi:hypothetical protein
MNQVLIQKLINESTALIYNTKNLKILFYKNNNRRNEI